MRVSSIWNVVGILALCSMLISTAFLFIMQNMSKCQCNHELSVVCVVGDVIVIDIGAHCS